MRPLALLLALAASTAAAQRAPILVPGVLAPDSIAAAFRANPNDRLNPRGATVRFDGQTGMSPPLVLTVYTRRVWIDGGRERDQPSVTVTASAPDSMGAWWWPQCQPRRTEPPSPEPRVAAYGGHSVALCATDRGRTTTASVQLTPYRHVSVTVAGADEARVWAALAYVDLDRLARVPGVTAWVDGESRRAFTSEAAYRAYLAGSVPVPAWLASPSHLRRLLELALLPDRCPNAGGGVVRVGRAPLTRRVGPISEGFCDYVRRDQSRFLLTAWDVPDAVPDLTGRPVRVGRYDASVGVDTVRVHADGRLRLDSVLVVRAGPHRLVSLSPYRARTDAGRLAAARLDTLLAAERYPVIVGGRDVAVSRYGVEPPPGAPVQDGGRTRYVLHVERDMSAPPESVGGFVSFEVPPGWFYGSPTACAAFAFPSLLSLTRTAIDPCIGDWLVERLLETEPLVAITRVYPRVSTYPDGRLARVEFTDPPDLLRWTFENYESYILPSWIEGIEREGRIRRERFGPHPGAFVALRSPPHGYAPRVGYVAVVQIEGASFAVIGAAPPARAGETEAAVRALAASLREER